MTALLDPLRRVFVLGTGITGCAVARSLSRRGLELRIADDRPAEAGLRLASELGLQLEDSADMEVLGDLVAWSDAVAPAPGVPQSHAVFELARIHDRPVLSELDLAQEWTDVPMVAVTGTNGKTTVTTLISEMLVAAGLRAPMVGNTDIPVVEAVDSGLDTDVFVVEASSFRLAPVQTFHPRVAVFLNIAPDHLDWHGTHDAYAAAKSRIAINQTSEDLLIIGEGEVEVAALTAGAASRRVTAGVESGDVCWDPQHRVLSGAEGLLVELEAPPRRNRPHDLSNSAAAAMAAWRLGASSEAIGSVLARFEGISHRQQVIGTRDGAVWIDDSKATAPHATAAALGAYESIVLLAGGRNKDLDLSVLGEMAGRVRAVIALGEAAAEISDAFESVPTVSIAHSMVEAVEAAAAISLPGDTILLSPACASYDWYSNYADRGDDFTRLALIHGVTR